MLLNRKGNGYWYMQQMGWILKASWLVKKASIRDCILFDFIYYPPNDCLGGDERDGDGENRDEGGRGWVWL